MENIFKKVRTEKDLNNLKRLITKTPELYQEILEVRKELNKKEHFLNTKTLVKKILHIEKKLTKEERLKPRPIASYF